jgi:stage V sporulation protein R
MNHSSVRREAAAPTRRVRRAQPPPRFALEQPLPPPAAARGAAARSERLDFELIEQYHEAIRATAQRFGLDTYPNQLEIITAEQMMDAYASVGMPVNYRHWSYGKEFIANEKNYKRGHMGLAYEIVINSDPCISYLMEENTTAMQALVIAHCGLRPQQLLQGQLPVQAVDRRVVDHRLPRLREELHRRVRRALGLLQVEELLDSCHALQSYGVDATAAREDSRFPKRRSRSANGRPTRRPSQRHWRTVAQAPRPDRGGCRRQAIPGRASRRTSLFLREERALLEPWQREIVRIVARSRSTSIRSVRPR